ncbi:MAG: phage tail tube protein [Parvibaculum sp.]|uniref:phage tail tube protein n=1 Tax=Parvibaculum sp. TaxID=2024848 RepID=UPI002ABC41D1|nr:phage tail tube protein [Parvibaculum sp.]MDZ4382803.1 phage tail tube protein [Parvibaculum sp.]
MTRPTTLAYSKFVLRISDGASPEVFAAPCGLTSRGWQEATTFQESAIPDCADEDAPAAIERDADTWSGSFSGSGWVAKENLGMYREWSRSGASKKCRIYYFDGEAGDELDESAIGYDEGMLVLSSLNVSGERGQKTRIEIEMQTDGAVTWTDAA